MSKIAVFIPVFIGDIGLVYFKNPTLNNFGGVDVEGTQILKSPAGYYIGSLYKEGDTSQEPIKGMPDYFFLPYSRDSAYYPTREEAELNFENKTYSR